MKASSGNFATVIAQDEFLMFDIITITLLDGTIIRMSNADIRSAWVVDQAGGGSVAHEFISAASTK